MYYKNYLCFFFFVFSIYNTFAQNTIIKGKINPNITLCIKMNLYQDSLFYANKENGLFLLELEMHSDFDFEIILNKFERISIALKKGVTYDFNFDSIGLQSRKILGNNKASIEILKINNLLELSCKKYLNSYFNINELLKNIKSIRNIDIKNNLDDDSIFISNIIEKQILIINIEILYKIYADTNEIDSVVFQKYQDYLIPLIRKNCVFKNTNYSFLNMYANCVFRVNNAKKNFVNFLTNLSTINFYLAGLGMLNGTAMILAEKSQEKKKFEYYDSIANIYLNDKTLQYFWQVNIKPLFSKKNEMNREILSSFIFNNKKKVTINKLINENFGKLIYIDLWASWCQPCIKEMPKSKLLINKYKNKITFIYIALEEKSKYNAYYKLNKSLHLPIANSYLLNETDLEQVFEKISNLLPRFILIGKNGELLDFNAKRPSDPTLINDFNYYLSN